MNREGLRAMQKKPWPLDTRTVSNLIVVLVGILFYFLLYRFGEVREKISMVAGVLSPFIVGFAIAYLLNTPTTFFEEKVYGSQKHSRVTAIGSRFGKMLSKNCSCTATSMPPSTVMTGNSVIDT